MDFAKIDVRLKKKGNSYVSTYNKYMLPEIGEKSTLKYFNVIKVK